MLLRTDENTTTTITDVSGDTAYRQGTDGMV